MDEINGVFQVKWWGFCPCMMAFEHSVLFLLSRGMWGSRTFVMRVLFFLTSYGRITVKIMSGGGDLHRKAVSKPCHKSGVSYFRTVGIFFIQERGMGKPCRHNTLALAGLELRIVLHT